MDMMGVGMWGMSVPGWAYAFLPLFALWSLFWKGLALWHSAQRGQSWWFVALLVINTLGILEIVYLLVIAKLKLNELFSSRVRTEKTA
jgi:methionyl-tRNA synthetase